MELNGMFEILDWIVLAFGVYALYSAWVLQKEGKIIKTFLMSKEVNVDSCKDLQGYANYMSPKLWTLGGVMLAYSAISLINAYVVEITSLFWVMMTVFFVALIWYGMETKKATKKYF